MVVGHHVAVLVDHEPASAVNYLSRAGQRRHGYGGSKEENIQARRHAGVTLVRRDGPPPPVSVLSLQLPYLPDPTDCSAFALLSAIAFLNANGLSMFGSSILPTPTPDTVNFP